MTVLDKENYEDLIKDGVVLVDFYADWCGPCRMMGMVLEELDEMVKIVKINVDKHEDIAKNYGVMSIPTLIIFKDGELVRKHVGFTDKDTIMSWINELS